MKSVDQYATTTYTYYEDKTSVAWDQVYESQLMFYGAISSRSRHLLKSTAVSSAVSPINYSYTFDEHGNIATIRAESGGTTTVTANEFQCE